MSEEANEKYLGTVEVEAGELRIADPCMWSGSGQNVTVSIDIGREAWAVVSVDTALTKHGNTVNLMCWVVFDTADNGNEDGGWEYAGHVAVDSGCVLIGDPTLGQRVEVSSGLGDGLYPVMVDKAADGTVRGVVIAVTDEGVTDEMAA